MLEKGSQRYTLNIVYLFHICRPCKGTKNKYFLGALVITWHPSIHSMLRTTGTMTAMRILLEYFPSHSSLSRYSCSTLVPIPESLWFQMFETRTFCKFSQDIAEYSEGKTHIVIYAGILEIVHGVSVIMNRVVVFTCIWTTLPFFF